MSKRNMVTAALLAVGVFVSLEYTSLAQSSQPTTQPSPGTNQQNGTTTQPSPGTAGQNGTTTQPSPGTNQQNGTTTELSASDRKFITEAAQGGMAEVQLGQLALKRASSKAVKKYAQQMIDEHTKANKELMALASKKGVTPPKSIGSKYRKVREKLSKLSGKNFDKQYMNEAGVKAHTEQEALYRRQSQQGQDPQLRAFAKKTLPVVQKHLQEARKITGTASPSPTSSPSPSPTSSPSPSPTYSPSPSPTSSPSPSPTSSPSPSPTYSPSPSPTSSPSPSPTYSPSPSPTYSPSPSPTYSPSPSPTSSPNQ